TSPWPPTVSLPPSTAPALASLSLHDALPIFPIREWAEMAIDIRNQLIHQNGLERLDFEIPQSACPRYVGHSIRHHDDKRNFKIEDRKSTRLNSSHVKISYAVFCLK